MEPFDNYSEEQLRQLKRETIRAIGTKTTLLSMINEELAERTPHDQEAVVVEIRGEE